MIAPVMFVFAVCAAVFAHLVAHASQEHIKDLQERNGWLYDQNRQQAERIRELEQKCQ